MGRLLLVGQARTNATESFQISSKELEPSSYMGVITTAYTASGKQSPPRSLVPFDIVANIVQMTGTFKPNCILYFYFANGTLLAGPVVCGPDGSFSVGVPPAPGEAFYALGDGGVRMDFVMDAEGSAVINVPAATATAQSTTMTVAAAIATTTAALQMSGTFKPNGIITFFDTNGKHMPPATSTTDSATRSTVSQTAITVATTALSGLATTKSITETSAPTAETITMSESKTTASATTSDSTQTSSTSTSTPTVATWSGTFKADAAIDFFYANGTLFTNVTSDSSGAFKAIVAIMPGEAMYAVGEGKSPIYFTTDAYGNAAFNIPPATSTTTQSTTSRTATATRSSTSATITTTSRVIMRSDGR
jgi:hypothetical protein